MDHVKFRRLRQIILDSATFISRGVSLDTEKVREKGYSDDEIANAEYLLTESSYFVKGFVDEIRQITIDVKAELSAFLVEFAKIILVVYEDSQKSMHFFEGDLQKMVLFGQYLGFWTNFYWKNQAYKNNCCSSSSMNILGACWI